MNPSQLIQTDSGYRSFVPAPLPPKIEWSSKLITLLSEAERAIAQLAEVENLYILAF
jgi:hypothetical protein